MAEWSGMASSDGKAQRNDGSSLTLEPKQKQQKMLEAKHKIFLSHSGADKLFVEYLCYELERCLRFPFFDLREDSLPIGENFANHIFAAIKQCDVGVVILSEDFLKSKWPMMELVGMVKEAKRRSVEEAKRRSDYKLIPVLLRISFAELDDPKMQKQWQKCWNEMEVRNPGRIKAGECAAALKYIRPLNGVVNTGGLDNEFVKKVIDRICGVVPVEINTEDSYIQGKPRICKAILDKIELQLKNGSRVAKVGIFGVGGIGKTTICKALRNDLFTRFRGRVCHAELERVDEKVLLRDVLTRVSNKRGEVLDNCTLDELQSELNQGKFITEAIFLAVDNMSDASKSIMEAKRYLSAKLPDGSIVVVTTRSKELLMKDLELRIDECMEFPELEEEEARALFLKSCEGAKGIDEQLLERCIKRCYFRKGDGEGSYVPLALNVLGRQLAHENDAKKWDVQLAMVENDVFNQSYEGDYHPIFSILRTSFDSLREKNQVLFMDVALFTPKCEETFDSNILEWLEMVHGRVEDVKIGLEELRRKSLLESFEETNSMGRSSGSRNLLENFVGEREGISVRMHDLWRSFCVAESKSGKLKKRRWSYERKTFKKNKAFTESSLCENSPSGNCWVNVKRMAFMEYSSMGLGRVEFGHFTNVIVLKIMDATFDEHLVVDLSKLVRLRSLEIEGCSLTIENIPKDLLFLKLEYYDEEVSNKLNKLNKPILKQIETLRELQHLELAKCVLFGMLDLTSMISLQKANFVDTSLQWIR